MMKPLSPEIESPRLFSDSSIWAANVDYYQKTGVSAWQSKEVSFNMTSSSATGKTYADIILGVL